MSTFDCATLERVAEKFGTPTYLTDFSIIEKNYNHMMQSTHRLTQFGKTARIFYSVKANANPFIIKFLNRLGAGAEVLSEGELGLCLKSGLSLDDLLFGGTMISNSLLKQVAKLGIKINLDSIESVSRAADCGIKRAAIRLNPLVEAGHHNKVKTAIERSKFGIALLEFSRASREFEKCNLTLDGIQYHIGSGITSSQAFVQAFEQVISSVPELPSFRYIDIGGGYAMNGNGDPFDFDPLVASLIKNSKSLPAEIFLESGRYLVGDSTILLARVVEVKRTGNRAFVGIDAGFNDMMRTVLYGAEHPVICCGAPDEKIVADLVGPICETGDVFLTDATLQAKEGSLIAILNVGAYGYSLSSNYLVRPRGAEIGTHDGNIFPMRRRESLDALMASINWQEYERFSPS